MVKRGKIKRQCSPVRTVVGCGVFHHKIVGMAFSLIDRLLLIRKSAWDLDGLPFASMQANILHGKSREFVSTRFYGAGEFYRDFQGNKFKFNTNYSHSFKNRTGSASSIG